MERILILLASLFLVATTVSAETIKNKANQKLLIKLNSGRNLELAPQSATSISSSELSTPALQTLISHGVVAVMQSSPPSKKPTFNEKFKNSTPASGKHY